MNLARGVGFEPKVKPILLSKRIYEFLVSNGAACLRDIYEALDENPHNVDQCLRRLWKRKLILRTRESTFEFEVNRRGRGGATGHVRAINYYAINDAHDLPAGFVEYDERKKDGRSREVESKADRILQFLQNNK